MTRLIIVITICCVLRVNASPIKTDSLREIETLQSDSRSLKQMMRIYAVLESLSSLEDFVESSEISQGGSPKSSINLKHQLKWEQIDLALDFFESIDAQLRIRVKANLPRIGTLDEVLRKNSAHYKRLRNTQQATGPESYSSFLNALANEYRRTRLLRLKGVPELNPVRYEPESRMGALIDFLSGCTKQPQTGNTSSEIERNLTQLVKLAEDEYKDELKQFVLDVQRGDVDGYKTLERLEDYFLQFVVRILKGQIFTNAARDNNTASQSLQVDRLRSRFETCLRDFGFVIEACTRLRRVSDSNNSGDGNFN